MKKIKPVPFRHRPKGLTIIYEDQDIIVANKSCGLLTVEANYERVKTAHRILTIYIRKGSLKSKKLLFPVHRLDRDTSGVLVFAKSFDASETLKMQWKDVKNRYIAVVHGTLKEKSGTISSYLTENEKHEVHSVKDHKKGDLAKTRYKVVGETRVYSLIEIELLTSRKNQIRVHLSERGHPLVGDTKYGKKDGPKGRLALHSQFLTFKHPRAGKDVTFQAEVPFFFKRHFKIA
ncbi:MAG: RluA family pseudouridine synthase [Candidatus Scalindua sp.]|jgi:tRNA pseudouridine32 synthase/23S rRNA pseudouridine746 synthase/23S rRNA pseudouridine1911/1915/1917 synthase|nr:RluA family pseudouridine synthase [Candidatus Scalindua sp.]